jgi:NAD(P)H-dependent FMN reductase
VDVLDLVEYALPLLDEPLPAAWGEYRNAHTDRWAAAIAGYDGFVFVTPEYNHSVPAALKNAIDYVFAEWHDKAAGFVSYGAHSGGTRAVEHLRQILAEVKVATVRTQVALSLFTDFEITDPTQPGICAPAEQHEATLSELLDEVVAWSTALSPLRAETVPA